MHQQRTLLESAESERRQHIPNIIKSLQDNSTNPIPVDHFMLRKIQETYLGHEIG
jgi:hypothetical protein